MFHAISIRRIVTAAFLAILIGFATSAIAPNPASAATTDPDLYATASSGYNSGCQYDASVHWNRASNHLDGRATVESHYWFAACRKSVIVTFIDDEGQEYTSAFAVPTACGTTDPTCSSRQTLLIDKASAVSKRLVPFISDLKVAVVDRLR